VRFDPPLVPATLLRRYKRFLVDVQLTGGATDAVGPVGPIEVAHCTNTGRMTGCSAPGSEVLIQPASGANRRLKWTLRLVRVGRTWVNVDTGLPNLVVAEALRNGEIPELAGYDEVLREAPFGARSRVDVLLRDTTGRLPPCFVEVKNVTLKEGRFALFPDAVSTRALKHLEELQHEVAAGNRAVLVPFVSRGDCDRFDAAREIDPDWANALVRAHAAGVEVMPWQAHVERRGVRLRRPLPFIQREAQREAQREQAGTGSARKKSKRK